MKTKSASLGDFFSAIDRILKISWGENWGKFTKAYPSFSDANELNTPIITYRLVQKTPGVVGAHKEIKPRVRAQYKVGDSDSEEVITVFGQRFDCIVQFEVWASNDSVVSDYADEFEDFMLTYTGILKEMGIIEVIYLGTTDEPSPNAWRVDLQSRSIKYHVVIDKLTPVSSKTIENIRLKLQILGEEEPLEFYPLH